MLELRNFIAEVGNNSSLVLDPQLNSYWTMNVAVVRLPVIQDLLTSLVIHGEDMTRREGLASATRGELDVLAGLARFNIDQAKHDVDVAVRSDPTRQVGPRLTAPLQEFDAAADEFLRPLGQQVVSGAAGLDPANAYLYVAAGTKALSAGFKFWDAAAGALDTVLDARIAQLSQKKLVFTILIPVPMLLLVLYLWVAFYPRCGARSPAWRAPPRAWPVATWPAPCRSTTATS